ncbi:hypothetical protein [Azohydromonas australica]|uniref:hypothetical protein n=1 Tax=Azohydromonas australica TaxID=364039 RepID=UPI0004234C2C|nr:hypothetical protein [Azohydromonas australica]
MNARRPWRLTDRFLATLALAACALALPAPGLADTPAAAAMAPLAEAQAPADLPPPTLSPATAAAPSAAGAPPQAPAPEPNAMYVLALVAAGLLGGWRRAFS